MFLGNDLINKNMYRIMNYRSMSEKESRYSNIFKNFHGKDLDDLREILYVFIIDVLGSLLTEIIC
jgi:hypothetical protein